MRNHVHDIMEEAQKVTTKGASFGMSYMYCLLYTSPSPRDATLSRMPSSA